MKTASNSRVLQMILLFVVVCFLSTPALAQYGEDASVYQSRNENFETGDFSKFPWEHNGDANWDITQEEKFSGIHCAGAGLIDHNQSTTVKLTLDCISGEISFYYKVSSERHYDYLRFYIDGSLQDEWSGNEDWIQVTFPVRSGRRTFEWTYSKDDSSSDGADAAWIDDIEFPVRGPCLIEAGELRATLEYTGKGVSLTSLFDLTTDTEFTGPMPTDFQLFQIVLWNTKNGNKKVLKSESGWNITKIESIDVSSCSIIYESPTQSGLSGIKVILPIFVKANSNAIHLGLQVQKVPEPWAVEEVKFPRLKVANRGPHMRVLIPQGPGQVLKESFNYRSLYPCGTTSMPYFAFYDSQGNAGLYVGTHDPWPSVREFSIEQSGELDDIVLTYKYPAPNSDQSCNGFEFPGEAVLQLFRGDWYDATIIYRDWVWANAKWYPKLSENGREDTALWMRELPVWIRSWNHYTIADDLNWAKQFAGIVGLPTGLRWYNWHQIPFDNDYPHFFPAKPGFHEAIIELATLNAPINVMPYINGTCWDTRDRGIADFQFTNVALGGAAKNEQGEPFIWSFAQEADGSPAQLAMMCPTSSVWKEKQHELVLRVVNELDAKAVYMDCIGCISPHLCFDHSHGHPTGGGSWWTRSYWDIVESIRRDIPSDCILTTEGSSEAYVHVFDGFLGYWDHDGAVPAFPAIYGGAIQVFARTYNYNPRDTLTLAHCMQAGQGFVFGEQTGSYLRLPMVLREIEALDFIKQIIHLRWELRRFFYAGKMRRHPKLYGRIPVVSADCGASWWTEGDENWVTTDAVLTGAWKIAHEQRLVLLFVNVSDKPVTATLDFDAATYGLPSGQLKGTVIVSPVAGQGYSWRVGPPSEPTPLPSTFQRELGFPPRFAWAWIIEP